MGVNSSIEDLANATLTVQRTTELPRVNGIKVPGVTSTFTCIAVVQPAYNINRVVGGADLKALVDGQSVTNVRIAHTIVELKTRSPNNDPDVILNYKGSDWTVIRVEEWEDADNEIHYKSIITKKTFGAS